MAYPGYIPAPNDEISREPGSIDAALFYKKYVQARRPVVLTGLLDEPDNQCLRDLASLDHLRRAASHSTVKIEPAHPETGAFGTGATRRTVSFPDFIDLLSDPAARGRWYLTTQYDDEEEEELDAAPSDALDGADEERLLDPVCPSPTDALVRLFPPRPRVMGNLVLQQCNLWMGNSPDGTSSGLHHDAHDNLYILLAGNKRLLLFPPSAHRFLRTRGAVRRVHPNELISYREQGDDSDAEIGYEDEDEDGKDTENEAEDNGDETAPRADGLQPLDAARWQVRFCERRVRELELEADAAAAPDNGVKGKAKQAHAKTGGKGKGKEKQKESKKLLAARAVYEEAVDALMDLELAAAADEDAHESEDDDSEDGSSGEQGSIGDANEPEDSADDDDEDEDAGPLFGAAAPDDDDDSADFDWGSEDGSVLDGEAILAALDAAGASAPSTSSHPTAARVHPPSFTRIDPAALHASLGLPPFPPSSAASASASSSLPSSATLSKKGRKKKRGSLTAKDADTAHLPRAGCPRPLVVHLAPGDALYLPTSWFHEVTSAAGPTVARRAGSGAEKETGEVPVHIAFNYWFHPPDGHLAPSSASKSAGTSTFTHPYADADVWSEIARAVDAEMDGLRATAEARARKADKAPPAASEKVEKGKGKGMEKEKKSKSMDAAQPAAGRADGKRKRASGADVLEPAEPYRRGTQAASGEHDVKKRKVEIGRRDPALGAGGDEHDEKKNRPGPKARRRKAVWLRGAARRETERALTV